MVLLIIHHHYFLLLITLIFSTTTIQSIYSSSSSTDSFIFGGCSQVKFLADSSYENTVNSILTSVINSASFTNYNNFTVPGRSASDSSTVYGLFQCRGDLKNEECSRCVTRAVSELGTLCLGSSGGALQLEGCFVKYDNATFLGVEDKTEVIKKCGPPNSFGLTGRDDVLAYLQSSDGGITYKTTVSGDFQGVSQCTGDLSSAECHDCVSDSIQRLKTECGASTWGQVYLAKCYTRYSSQGGGGRDDDNHNHNDDEIEKTLAILIGLIAGVALIIVFLSFLSKVCEKQRGGK